ncbi:hypothetical protein ACFV3R_24315 [Streptomyces sp. NPDC059740]|uniref:hypothetical protein n=1 Tax=Streptomyces sp. NPDC059740 TaxID=3346926 RepID=UPI003658419C
MVDTTPLQAAVDSLAERLRALPQSALHRGAAATGLTLARELARRAQRLESPEQPLRTLPEEGVFTVGDQVAVAGHDLVEAVRGAGPEGEGALVEALELVRSAARSC